MKNRRLTEEELQDKTKYIKDTAGMGLKYRAIITALARQGVIVSASALSSYLGLYRRGPKPDDVILRSERICREYRTKLISDFKD